MRLRASASVNRAIIFNQRSFPRCCFFTEKYTDGITYEHGCTASAYVTCIFRQDSSARRSALLDVAKNYHTPSHSTIYTVRIPTATILSPLSLIDPHPSLSSSPLRFNSHCHILPIHPNLPPYYPLCLPSLKSHLQSVYTHSTVFLSQSWCANCIKTRPLLRRSASTSS